MSDFCRRNSCKRKQQDRSRYKNHGNHHRSCSSGVHCPPSAPIKRHPPSSRPPTTPSPPSVSTIATFCSPPLPSSAPTPQTRVWKLWEKEVLQETVPAAAGAGSDTSKFRLTKELSFVKHHTGTFTHTPAMFYLVCFFRQFVTSVRRSDYLAMRHVFFSVHLTPGAYFNFQKYIKRSLEDDFKVIVGISPPLWATAVLFLLANVDGARAMIYLSIFPVIILLAVGTKLQAIVTQLAVEIQERQAVAQGIPIVELSDRHFWFSEPRLILYLIHLTLFQNSFEITHFFWIWYEFGLDSCFNENPVFQYGRVVMGILIQWFCSYSILPQYALVTQMGSTMKQSIFDEHTSEHLKNWHEHVKKKDKKGKTKPPGDAQVNIK